MTTARWPGTSASQTPISTPATSEPSSLTGSLGRSRTPREPADQARGRISTTEALSEAACEILSLEVECGSSAPTVVGAALGKLKELGPARDDAILVASELVTDAVVHSGGSPGDTVHVRAALGQGRVSISVQDPGLSSDSPRVRGSDGLRAHGRDLRIVNERADRWGFERDRGRRVWAELRLSSAATASGCGDRS